MRLSSLQPEDWTPRFYDLWASGRVCRQLHFSLAEWIGLGTQEDAKALQCSPVRPYRGGGPRRLPGVAITTDVIAGFPGESEAEQVETEQFLRSIGFAGLHVFKYSPRSGTDAAEMPGSGGPHGEAGAERAAASDLAREMRRDFNGQSLGRVLSVLWEEPVPVSEAHALGFDGSRHSVLGTIRQLHPGLRCQFRPRSAGSISGAAINAVAGEGVIATPCR